MLTKKENPKQEVKVSKADKCSTSSTTHSSENNDTCCPSPAKPGTQTPFKTPHSLTTHSHESNKTEKRSGGKTRLTIKYDVGFSNQLFIRGKGANLSWDKGQLLKNVKPDEWIWECETPFNTCEFKILINDHVYENGDNHQINSGCSLVYTPNFY